MPRAIVPPQGEFPYSVSARCINKDWFTLPMDFVWDAFSDQLNFVSHAYDVRIHNFVLMHNHFHLLVTTPKLNLSDSMGWFLRETSRTLTRAGNRINQTFGGRHFRCVIQSDHYFMNAYKYIYYNPVAAGICDRVEAYKYSTLNSLLGFSRAKIPLVEDRILFPNVEKALTRLNLRPPDEHLETVRRALRKKSFRLPRTGGYLHALETDAL